MTVFSFFSVQLALTCLQKAVTGEREEVQAELTRLQEENDSLQGKHSKHAEQLQNEDINLPNNLDVCRLSLMTVFGFYIRTVLFYFLSAF